jgi:hypothetical protein
MALSSTLFEQTSASNRPFKTAGRLVEGPEYCKFATF